MAQFASKRRNWQHPEENWFHRGFGYLVKLWQNCCRTLPRLSQAWTWKSACRLEIGWWSRSVCHCTGSWIFNFLTVCATAQGAYFGIRVPCYFQRLSVWETLGSTRIPFDVCALFLKGAATPATFTQNDRRWGTCVVRFQCYIPDRQPTAVRTFISIDDRTRESPMASLVRSAGMTYGLMQQCGRSRRPKDGFRARNIAAERAAQKLPNVISISHWLFWAPMSSTVT